MFLFSKFQKDGQSVLSFYIKKVIFDKEEKANCLVTILVKLEDLTVSSRQLLRLDIGVEALLTKVNILSFVGRMVSETAAHLCPLAFLQPQTIWKPMGMAVFQLNMSRKRACPVGSWAFICQPLFQSSGIQKNFSAMMEVFPICVAQCGSHEPPVAAEYLDVASGVGELTF